ncbi:uncharacterized protein LOC128214598 [Mya arenaria]|uniref:uncharacterized protein LOC128214598 n=1 Tax=Mya arenaria TaxID=6604 RepID=UPI0022E80270|nr:uncharacterized protein LOC128214598 [Mya arenaria]
MELLKPLSVLILHTIRTEGEYVYRRVEDRCLESCARLNNIPNVTFDCGSDNSSCDWQCAAQRMGCDEGLAYHCAQDFKNYKLKRNKIEYIEACAPEKFCNAGEEPYVTFPFDDKERSPRNAMINCVPCTDPNFYNSQAGKSSASYSQCQLEKFNKCIPEDYKINCGDIFWRKRTETDGYCRCDARNGYAPENENVKTKCFYSDEFCIEKTCPPAQELLLNYTCGDRCPPGMHRTEESDECVPDEIFQTTKNTPSILTSQRSTEEAENEVAISTTTETKTGIEEKGTTDDSNKDISLTIKISLGVFAGLTLLSISTVIFLKCKKQPERRDPEQTLTKDASIIFNDNRKTINKTVTHIARDQVKVTGDNSNVQTGSDPTETSPQDIEEANFSFLFGQTLLKSDQEIENQCDFETPLLSGYEENHPLESSGNTTAVMIEERDENAVMNPGSCQSPIDGVNGIAVAGDGCELCPCDNQEDDKALYGPVLEGKIPAKTLSSKNNPLPPNSVLYTHGATLCRKGDDETMEHTRTNGQETHCTKSGYDETKEKKSTSYE